jgi:hypothetical protein
MSAKRSAAGEQAGKAAVMRAFVRARIVGKPEFSRTARGVGVCRIQVVGEARGPASKAPEALLYIRDGGEGQALRFDEAVRCAFNLRPGDLIQAVGSQGAQRRRARLPEVIVEERVKLLDRAVTAGGAA